MTDVGVTPPAVVDDRLLKALADELKLPLLQIARQAELEGGATIEALANQALWLVDGYLLSQQLQQQAVLQLEPVPVSAVLQEVAHKLTPLARQYNCHLQLDIGGRFGPVMAHRQALQTALVSVGASLLTAASAKSGADLLLATHRSHGGVVAGVFSQANGLSQTMYQRGRELAGRARQPLHQLTNQPATGVFVADALFEAMQTRLRVARHHQLTGLAATLLPSQQLALV